MNCPFEFKLPCTHFWRYIGALLCAGPGFAAHLQLSDDLPLELAAVGSYQLRVLTPIVLELTLVTTKKSDSARPEQFDFVDAQGQSRLPAKSEFIVTVGTAVIPIKSVGFKRRVLYAPFKERDLRIGNYLYLQLDTPVMENQTVEVKNPSRKLWPASAQFVAKTDPLRWSPMIHVNQTGYDPAWPKKAIIGYYAGSLGEVEPGATLVANPAEPRAAGAIASNLPLFRVINAESQQEVLQGRLRLRPDEGFPSASYQRVFEADFSALTTPGEYRVLIPGLGGSYRFRIDAAVAGVFARTYALGIYHQRCGSDNALPYSRFTHRACHTAPAEIPSAKYENVEYVLNQESANCKEDPRHVAPQLKSIGSGLFPFQQRGPIDVRGGHHDAGDYSKYTINSASFIHFLVFAVDVFPGVADLDNMGLPESGDGKSDVLQQAKWEADFLAKMQDTDGGFYFLVYPRDRRYENDVLPDKSDPQVVFPKTTAVSAAAIAALAQCASSPTFQKQFPEAAATYLEKARKGWTFLENALATHGKDGAYQKITHYGDFCRHDDELAWAACELFLATGDPAYQKRLIEWFDPSDPNTRRWSWWRLFDAYGSAVRSYAFAVKAGKRKRDELQPFYLERCETEIAAAGEDQLRRAQSSAYGTSLSIEAKRSRSAGWYFSNDAAFDLAVAYQLNYPVQNDPRPKFLEALLSNLHYEQGCNPINVTYLTGLGWKRQREIVHSYALNDRRLMPPTGIPIGNIQAGFGWMDLYKEELSGLSFPSDGAEDSPYAFYDRWSDAFNLTQEFVVLNQARALAYLAWLMAQTPLKTQRWKAASGTITGLPTKIGVGQKVTVTLAAPGLDFQTARVVWETPRQEPALGTNFSFIPSKAGAQWIEAEAQLIDGRRIFAVTNFTVAPR
jgi:hypothetical protein